MIERLLIVPFRMLFDRVRPDIEQVSCSRRRPRVEAARVDKLGELPSCGIILDVSEASVRLSLKDVRFIEKKVEGVFEPDDLKVL